MTLTSGTLPAWDGTVNTFLNAQVYGYDSSGNCVTLASGSVPCTVATVASNTSFTITPALSASYTNITFVLSKRWDAALAAMQYNFSSFTLPLGYTIATPTVNGWGYAGSDGGSTIDLSPAGYSGALWLFDDSFWARSADSGADRTTLELIDNCVAVQNGYNMASSGALNFYIYNQPGQDPQGHGLFHPTNPNITFFNSYDSSSRFWPQGGICINATNVQIVFYATVNSKFGGFPTVLQVTNIMNGSSVRNPKDWIMQEISLEFSGQYSDFPGASGGSPLDVGDNYYYWLLGAQSYRVKRFLKSDIANIDWDKPQEYLGKSIGWDSNESVNGSDVFPRSKAAGQIMFGPKGLAYYDSNSATYKMLYNYKITSGLYKHADNTRYVLSTLDNNYIGAASGMYTTTTAVENGWNETPTKNMFYCTQYSDASTFGSGGNLLDGSVIGWYDVNAHPEQTWTGRTSGDMLFTIDSNTIGGYSTRDDASTYWVTPYRVTGI